MWKKKRRKMMWTDFYSPNCLNNGSCDSNSENRGYSNGESYVIGVNCVTDESYGYSLP
ncbi:MAG: hypothetical protein II859_08185 [Bacteroidales bacterium]|nr:hypothetical protein [Bacteroidales bacterium]